MQSIAEILKSLRRLIGRKQAGSKNSTSEPEVQRVGPLRWDRQHGRWVGRIRHKGASVYVSLERAKGQKGLPAVGAPDLKKVLRRVVGQEKAMRRMVVSEFQPLWNSRWREDSPELTPSQFAKSIRLDTIDIFSNREVGVAYAPVANAMDWGGHVFLIALKGPRLTPSRIDLSG